MTELNPVEVEIGFQRAKLAAGVAQFWAQNVGVGASSKTIAERVAEAVSAFDAVQKPA